MRLLISALAAIFLISVSDGLAQQECLPVLRPDIVDLSHETEKNLVLLEKRLQQEDNRNSGSIIASYGAYQLDARQARQARSSLSTLLDIDYSETEKFNLYLSTLSDNAVTAFVACLRERHRPISHNFVGDILSRDSFFVQVNWHPNYRPEGETQKLTAKLTDGVFVETTTQLFESTIKPTDSAFFTVKRDPFKGTQIAVIIDGKVEIIDIPRRARYRVIQSEVIGDYRETNTRETSGDIGWDVCVSLGANDRDQALIPNTFDFVFERNHVDRVTLVTNNPRRETSRSACSHLGIVFQTVFKSYAIVKAAGKVQTFKRIDLTTEPQAHLQAQRALSLNPAQ